MDAKYNVTLNTGFTFPVKQVKKGNFIHSPSGKKTGESIDVTFLDNEVRHYHPNEVKSIRKI